MTLDVLYRMNRFLLSNWIFIWSAVSHRSLVFSLLCSSECLMHLFVILLYLCCITPTANTKMHHLNDFNSLCCTNLQFTHVYAAELKVTQKLLKEKTHSYFHIWLKNWILKKHVLEQYFNAWCKYIKQNFSSLLKEDWKSFLSIKCALYTAVLPIVFFFI